MIRVGFNVRSLTKPDPAGVSRYTYNLLSALVEQADDTGVEYVLFGFETLPEPFDRYDCIENAEVPVSTHSGLRAHVWEQLTLPRALKQYDLDLFHAPAGQPPLRSTVPLVTTIHDLSPVTHPEWFSHQYATLYRLLTPLAVRFSAHLLAVSVFTKQEIERTYPNARGKTTAVHNGVTPPATDGTPVERVSNEHFLLFVGAANQRKNLSTVLRAFRQYRSQATDPASLVLVGPDRGIFSENSFKRTAGIEPLGYVPDEQLDWLYRHAAAFVFPSLYEGFGLPILEAMSVGTPVITSNQGALAEVAGEAASLVDPSRTTDLRDAIERILTDQSYRAQLATAGRERAASFSWQRTAEQTLEVYHTVAGRQQG